MRMEMKGAVFPSYEVRPDRRLAEQFIAGTGGEGAPDAVPPTYMIFLRGESLGLNLFEQLGIPRQRALHGGQRYDWGVPIRWDDTLSVTATVSSIVEKQGSAGRIWFADIEFVYTNQNGERALTEITRLIERE